MSASLSLACVPTGLVRRERHGNGINWENNIGEMLSRWGASAFGQTRTDNLAS